MIVSILQSNYIPWKGYFDIIAKSDVFVIYDEVQYTKNDWRNRNQIKSQSGKTWLTIPISKLGLESKIYEVETAHDLWVKKHKSSIQANYAKAKCFKEMRDYVFAIYDKLESKSLSSINLTFIEAICKLLDIDTKIIDSRELSLRGDRVEKLIDACTKLGADTYLSGASAKNYLDPARFAERKINVEWMDYNGYIEYNQLFPPFDHAVTILDLLFNEGDQARMFLKN
ncbi:WbqC family protein [Roseivirga spongicola]|uniref:WbqC family protein n=1 Tax=Roseivirga spongicola TaxID=333140 RepID=UPI002AC970CE|nr:WbqC family protein [Roseivirga spongicola]WPZ09164.1 WbqC family protein [Roseivirga spongicola]